MNPTHLHLMLNHIPVLGVIFAFLIFAFGSIRKNEEISRVGMYIFIFSALAVIPVYLTGEPAEEMVEHLPGILESTIEAHEDAAKFSMVLIELLGMAAMIGVILSFRLQTLPIWMSGVIFVLSVISGGTIARTANLGGQIRHPEINEKASAQGDNQEVENHNESQKKQKLNSIKGDTQEKKQKKHDDNDDD